VVGEIRPTNGVQTDKTSNDASYSAFLSNHSK